MYIVYVKQKKMIHTYIINMRAHHTQNYTYTWIDSNHVSFLCILHVQHKEMIHAYVISMQAHAIKTLLLYCNTPQYTATHCNTLQHTATHCNTRSCTQALINMQAHAITTHQSYLDSSVGCASKSQTKEPNIWLANLLIAAPYIVI